MNGAHDPLEAELEALRPHEVSSELRRRIAEQVGRSATPSYKAHPAPWRYALAGGLAAACLIAAVIFWWRGGRSVGPEPVVTGPRPAPPVEAETTLPTVLVYSRALARSSAELDTLLDQHARLGSQGNPEERPIHALTRFDVGLQRATGEL